MNNQLVKFAITVKNASAVNKPYVVFHNSKVILDATKAMYREGLIQSFATAENKILLKLRSVDGQAVTTFMKLHSKPTNPKYLKYEDLARLNFKRTEAFISTSKGVKTLTECKQKKIGGLFLFTC